MFHTNIKKKFRAALPVYFKIWLFGQFLFPVAGMAQHVQWDVHYGEAIEQTYDYYPNPFSHANDTCFVLIHGGGWTSGDKANWGLSGFILQQGGYHVLNLNYKFASSVWHWKDMNRDMLTAFNQIQLLHPYIGVFILIGASSGATMSFNYARTGDERVKFIIAVSGIYDFAHATIPDFLKEGVSHYTNDDFTGASPMMDSTTHYPKCAIFHGDADNIFPYQPAAEFSKKLTTDGVWNWFYVKPNMPHALNHEGCYALMNQIVLQIKRVP